MTETSSPLFEAFYADIELRSFRSAVAVITFREYQFTVPSRSIAAPSLFIIIGRILRTYSRKARSGRVILASSDLAR